MKVLLALTTVVILTALCEGSALEQLLKKLLEKEDDKRGLTSIGVTSTSISGYPVDWGQCPTFDCTYVVSCGNAGSKEVPLGQKAVFDNLKPLTSYTCSTCLKSDSFKCSATQWTCTTLAKGQSVSQNDLDAPCRSKITSKKNLTRKNKIDKIEELLEQLRN